jgi:hypothetical protein
MKPLRIIPLLFLALLFSSRGRADEAPCANEYKELVASTGDAANYEQLRQALQECEAKASAQKKKEFAETGLTWAQGLNPIAEGGWALLGVSPDGTFAVFGWADRPIISPVCKAL